MKYTLERLTQPEIEPVTLAEAKRHIRQFVNVTTEDDDVEALIQASREWVENYTGRIMVDQQWRLSVEQNVPASYANGDIVSGYSKPPYYGSCSLVNGGILLRRSPVLEVIGLVTVATDGTETEVDASTYQLRDGGTKWPRVVPLGGAVWTSGSFKITYRAGFADRLGSPVTGSEVIPATLKHAIKLIIANYDENRSPTIVGTIAAKLPQGVEWLLSGEKCDLGFA